MDIRPLSPALQKKANEELNEVPDRIQEDLQHLREWLQKQAHLKIRTDDQWLVGFLRGCKFSLQRAKEKLDYFYTMRTLVPEFFENRDPLLPEIQEILKAGALFALPKTANPTGPRILMFRWEDCDPQKISAINLLKVFFMIFDIMILEDDNCVVTGLQIWAEFKKFDTSYVLQLTPGVLKKAILCLQSAYPLRVKGIHCTNAPSVFEVIFNLCKQFMSKKLLSRFFVFNENNSSNFLKELPEAILPKDYGGECDSIDNIAAEWRKKIESYRDWFLEDAKYQSDEKLRLGKPRTTADVFGMEGTFRKLAID